MRSLSTGLRRGLALLALVLLVVPAAYADDPPSPYEPPGARINPPTGAPSQARIHPPVGAPTPDDPTTDARIGTPGGTPQTDARINPPGGASASEPSGFDLLLEWLRAQARISPPTG